MLDIKSSCVVNRETRNEHHFSVTKHGNAIWFWWTLMITRLHLENNIWHKVVIFVCETSYKYIIKIYPMLIYMVFILDKVTWWVVAQEEILSICTGHEKIVSTLCPSSWEYTQRFGYHSVAIVKWSKKICFVVAFWIETTNKEFAFFSDKAFKLKGLNILRGWKLMFLSMHVVVENDCICHFSWTWNDLDILGMLPQTLIYDWQFDRGLESNIVVGFGTMLWNYGWRGFYFSKRNTHHP